MSLPAIKDLDNRGTKEVPFGFVYVQNTRIGFSSAPHAIVFRSSGWNSTGTHLAAALEELKAKFPDHAWTISA